MHKTHATEHAQVNISFSGGKDQTLHAEDKWKKVNKSECQEE